MKPWERFKPQQEEAVINEQQQSNSAKPWENFKAPSTELKQTPFQYAKDKTLENVGNYAGLIGDYTQGALENVVAPIGTAIDYVGGAPTREAIYKAQKGEGVSGAAEGFLKQYGKAPQEAATGKLIAQEAGVPDTSLSDKLPSLYSKTGDEWFKLQKGGLLDPTASGAAGLGVDIGADWTNVIPIAAAFKGLRKGGGLLADFVSGAAKQTAKGTALATDIVTGTKAATKAVDATGGLLKDIKDVSKKIVAPPTVATLEKDIATANKLGIKNDELMLSTAYGQRSVPSMAERSVMETTGGGKGMEKYTNTIQKISDGVDSTISRLGDDAIGDAVETGERIKDAYKNAESELFFNNALTYKKAADLTPNMQLTDKAWNTIVSKANGLKKRAISMQKWGLTAEKRANGKMLEEYADNMLLERNYRQLADQIGEIGEEMTDEAVNKTVRKELKNLYSTISDSLIETVSDLHPDLGKQLVENNRNYTKFFRSRDTLGKMIQNAASNPESVFNTIARDAKKTEELKSILRPEDFNSFRGSYLNSLISRNAEGLVNYASTAKKLYANRGKLSKMFSPEEMQELSDILGLGLRSGSDRVSSALTSAGIDFKEPVKSFFRGKAVEEGLVNPYRRKAGLLSSSADDVAEEAAQMSTSASGKPTGLIEMEAVPEGLLGKGLDRTKKSMQKGGVLRRGPKELRAKGAQSVAPSYYNEREQR